MVNTYPTKEFVSIMKDRKECQHLIHNKRIAVKIVKIKWKNVVSSNKGWWKRWKPSKGANFGKWRRVFNIVKKRRLSSHGIKWWYKRWKRSEKKRISANDVFSTFWKRNGNLCFKLCCHSKTMKEVKEARCECQRI